MIATIECLNSTSGVGSSLFQYLSFILTSHDASPDMIATIESLNATNRVGSNGVFPLPILRLEPNQRSPLLHNLHFPAMQSDEASLESEDLGLQCPCSLDPKRDGTFRQHWHNHFKLCFAQGTGLFPLCPQADTFQAKLMHASTDRRNVRRGCRIIKANCTSKTIGRWGYYCCHVYKWDLRGWLQIHAFRIIVIVIVQHDEWNNPCASTDATTTP